MTASFGLLNALEESSMVSLSRLKGWIAPTREIPLYPSFGAVNQALSGFPMIARLSNGKWFWCVESDSTKLSTCGMGGVRETILHRALNFLLFGFPISL